ncbi:23S rRNA m(5)U-1939 methyltransferase [Pseudooceanicola nitratireducens]|uniref:23S rRNA m(5)U-1939 methyltransferase n=1 Tax=Pseudooceanicola nitratireducens TaxID=517719 RepID=A0A1I1HI88_9RHOB|nr:class I SAM-dependent RNA methyltransferase [Pseudooceanicola nitratireducens]SEJ10619.1 23S rRNA (uracil1939-C5)-methyltransferase [Pseudooceanicola nitratireducens]SFC21173.1 23S rRNA m(5)U-1939 methyltransferase [Pseudooceanicola nitratireducens]
MTEHVIERLGHQGDGIAPGPVFAPMTLPGEVVSGTLNGQRLDQVRIVTPSSDRVAAPCRHFKTCGGCQVQHASDGFVEHWKAGIVREALRAQGIEAEIAGVETSPPKSRRRAGLSARRTKKGAMAGFHGRASGTIVEIPDCQLLHPDLIAALPVAEALAVAGGSRKGELNVSVTLSDGGLDVAVRDGKPLDRDLEVALAQQAEALDLARLSWDGEVIAMRRAPGQIFGPARVVPPPGAFLQATPQGEAALLRAVTEITEGAARIADLFAGCGTFALPLARRAEVLAVEGDRAMIAALDRGWREAQGLKRVEGVTRDLFRNPLLRDEFKGIDAVVIDPPRAGAEAQVTELAEARVPVIAHVSCNPVTFARDAARLIAAGYAMGPVRVVDQFRWSSHVELVAGFRLTSA